MGLFNWLFSKSSLIEHEYFGQMRYIKAAKQKTGYLEAHVFFKPLGKPIECFVQGDSTGPFSNQQVFIEAIQANYQLVRTQVVSWLSPLFEASGKGPISDFEAEFNLVALSLHDITEGQATQWDILYEFVHDADHMFTILFEDWQAVGEQIDG
jgi:hypothetical protein